MKKFMSFMKGFFSTLFGKKKHSPEETFVAEGKGNKVSASMKIVVEAVTLISTYIVVTTFPFTLLLMVEFVIVYKVIKAMFAWMIEEEAKNEMAG